MIKLENYLGTIQISENFFANLVGYAASRCFGVAGSILKISEIHCCLAEKTYPAYKGSTYPQFRRPFDY